MGNAAANIQGMKPARLFRARDSGLAIVFTAVAVLIFLTAWQDIWRIGSHDEECSYVLLAPVVIGWLIWVRRSQLRDCLVRRGWVGVLVLAGGWAVYRYGYVTDPVVWRAGAVLVAVGAFVTAIGFDASFRLAPALAACVFLIPIDPNGRYHIAAPLQTATADVTQRICELLGIYVERAGNLLSINGVDVTIAEACNGSRMVLTLFMVCYVVAFTLPLKWYLRVLLLAASPLVAIASNVVRLVPTVWMFGHTSLPTAEKFHDISGWVMTILAFGFLMLVFRPFQSSAEETRRSLAAG